MMVSAEPPAFESAPDTPGQVPRLDRLRLRFPDPDVEAGFQATVVSGRSNVMLTRLGFVLATAMWIAFGALDWYLAPEVLPSLYGLRYGLGLPVFLAGTLATFTPALTRWRDALIAAITLTGGGLVIAFMAVMPAPEGAYYFSGIVLVIFFSACVLRPRPGWALANSLLLTGAYVGYALGPAALPAERIGNDLFFLVADSAVAAIAAYSVELGLRDKYARDVALERELAAAQAERRRAEEANALKTRFLANVSHELRTPLNAINGFAEVLANPDMKPLAEQKYPDYARDILGSGRHLLGLIDTVVDLSKAETNTLELAREAVPVAGLLGEVATLVQAEAEAADVTVTTHVPDGLPAIDGDPLRLRQILVNLAVNAIRVSPAGATVAVEAMQEPAGWLRLAVRDSGPGMTDAQVAEALQPFTQLGGPAERAQGPGSGLGLPIARELAHHHGGSLWLETAPGWGTVARVSVPAVAPTRA